MERIFSNHAKTVLGYSREEAVRLQNHDILPDHLLLGIIRDGEGKAMEAITTHGLNPRSLKQAIEKELAADNEYVDPRELTVSKNTAQRRDRYRTYPAGDTKRQIVDSSTDTQR